jgi:hypothetical protein
VIDENASRQWCVPKSEDCGTLTTLQFLTTATIHQIAVASFMTPHLKTAQGIFNSVAK